jgi:hypothetical protein
LGFPTSWTRTQRRQSLFGSLSASE